MSNHGGSNVLLEAAALDCDELFVSLVLTASASDLNAKDNEGRSVLHITACHGYGARVILILADKEFTETNSKDRDGRTALHLAAINGHFPVAMALVFDCDFTEQHARDKYNRKAIFYAAKHAAAGDNAVALALSWADKPFVTNEHNAFRTLGYTDEMMNAQLANEIERTGTLTVMDLMFAHNMGDFKVLVKLPQGEWEDAGVEETKEEVTCCICLDAPPTWVFVSCGHKCVCKACASKQKKEAAKDSQQSKKGHHKKNGTLVSCPICRTQSRVTPFTCYQGEVFD